jgi:hypothetical protein
VLARSELVMNQDDIPFSLIAPALSAYRQTQGSKG